MKPYHLVLILFVSISIQQCSQKVVPSNNYYGPKSKMSEGSGPYACDELITEVYNRVSGFTTFGSKNTLIISDNEGETGFGLSLHLKRQTFIIFSIEAVGAGKCIDENDLMHVVFRDGSELELDNDGTYNCDSNFALYFGGIFTKFKELDQFATKEVAKMRVTNEDEYIEKNFTKDQSLVLMHSFNCLKEVL